MGAMDTEFPGVVIYPTNSCENEDYGYQLVKGNVDLLKLIQLGITLFDSGGQLPEGVCTWQFNFKFDIETDMYAEESTSLLQNSGLQFEQQREHGIAPHDFAELMLSSGLVLSDSVTWLTFHSAYDFSYLLTQRTSLDLPATEAEFKELIRLYFPHIYDIKYLMLFTDNLIGGLQSVANYLNVERFGTQHQAGSDSLLQDVQPILLGRPGQCQVLRSDCWLQESWLGTKCCHPGQARGRGTAPVRGT